MMAESPSWRYPLGAREAVGAGEALRGADSLARRRVSGDRRRLGHRHLPSRAGAAREASVAPAGLVHTLARSSADRHVELGIAAAYAAAGHSMSAGSFLLTFAGALELRLGIAMNWQDVARAGW